MRTSLSNWFDSILFACEVHGVVSMRLTMLVQGGKGGPVCTENLNADVMVMKAAEQGV